MLQKSDDLGVNLSQLPSPTLRGDVIFVKINEDIYHKQVAKCKNSLLGIFLEVQILSCLYFVYECENLWKLMP